MRTYTSQSTVEPALWDATSSPDRVYHNFNVVVIEAAEDTPRMFEYTVDEYTQQEYARLQNEKIAALEEQIAMLVECVLEMSAAVYAE